MRCPLCNVAMREVDRRGVRIDVCPECRGVWLDGGELDKLLGLEDQWSRQRPEPEHGRGYPPHYPRKRKSFLRELFDFDD